jgi:hypothetical protein
VGSAAGAGTDSRGGSSLHQKSKAAKATNVVSVTGIFRPTHVFVILNRKLYNVS